MIFCCVFVRNIRYLCIVMKITEAKFAGSCTRVSSKPKRRLPEFAFIGRSNVGKSSLINMLTGNGKLAMTSSTPGKTRCINHFIINDSWYLVDLPGYGYARMSREGREELRSMINDYITGSEELQCLFVLVDSRFDITRIDIDFIAGLGEKGIPFAIVFTKCDKQGTNAVAAQIERSRNILLEDWETLPPVFASSAAKKQGKEEILDYIDSILSAE